ncbi:tigger transposable element-derived protein 2 [Elysia marginata]|uniref:Tigger transposable element-derived protein 2 n=1 Tax=Elysia marginata TaxID=1093978 RepID=A0AAV4IBP7_9GAST|nr:tigger transposable element-derived protein 2 [Elysia marginata]
MPRNHKRKSGSRRYRDYDEGTLLKAIEDCKSCKIADVAQVYKIPIRTLRNKVNGAHNKSPGRPTALSKEFDDEIAKHLLTCSDFGMPLDKDDIRYMVKSALDKGNVTIKNFVNDLPGIDWVRGFLTRQKEILSDRTYQNIKRARAEVDPGEIQEYFKNPGTRFGRSKSGWMDTVNFEEWFLSIVVPWARRKEGKKVVIGDNLSSHFSGIVLDKCEELNIGFILLPANATDKCQPLDVSFFAPLKKEWRKQLEFFKMKNPTSASIDKSLFPSMLSKLLEGMGARNSENLKAGFRTC